MTDKNNCSKSSENLNNESEQKIISVNPNKFNTKVGFIKNKGQIRIKV